MTSKKIDKLESILNNSINGNSSIFRKQVKKLTKLELLELIEYAQGQGLERFVIINKLRSALEY